MSPVRFAIVGAGLIGRTHAEIIDALDGAEVAAVVSPGSERGLALAQRFDVPHLTELDDALARDDVDAVVAATPSGLHAAVAVPALRAGKHVVIEKPIEITPDAVEAIVTAAAESDRAATVICQSRFEPPYAQVHQHVLDGKFGRITAGTADISWWRSQEYYDSGNWRGTWALDGGGALMNQGIHTIDMLVWLLGQPVEAFAWTGTLAHERIEVEDTAVATVRFASGALGAIHGTTAAFPGLSTRVQVLRDQGSAVLENGSIRFLRTSDSDEEIRGSGEGPIKSGSDPAKMSGAHRYQYLDFLDAIAAGRPPAITVGDGARTFDLIYAIYESARTGRPVAIAPRAA